MRGEIMLSHLISFHQFFERLFQSINWFFSNFDIKYIRITCKINSARVVFREVMINRMIIHDRAF